MPASFTADDVRPAPDQGGGGRWGMVGGSAALQEALHVLAHAARSDLPLLISGEPGTGKSLLARAVHDAGAQPSSPLVNVRLATIPKSAIEGELFAPETGVFARARGGTAFLSGIHHMPPEAQAGLLRWLHHRGEGAARVISASSADVSLHVKTGMFREDLYQQLNVLSVRLPPLRARAEDVPPLATHFLQRAKARGLPAKVLSRDAMLALQGHDWPGNIRELENLIYRLCAATPDEVMDGAAVQAHVQKGRNGAASLETAVREHLRHYFAAHGHAFPPAGMHGRVMAVVERPLIAETLRATGGNQLKAAALLGLNRNTLRKKMQELGVKAEE